MKHTLLFCIGLLFFATPSNAQAPNWLWAESGGGGFYQYGEGISADQSGNIFAAGRCSGTMDLGGISVTAGGATNPFVGEFNSSGTASWITETTYSGGIDYVFGFCKDNRDNTYTTGVVNSGAALFLDKHNKAGNKVWQITRTGTAQGNGIAADDNGNVYFTGQFNDTISFGGTLLTPKGTEDIFLAKFDSNGVAQWAISVGSSGNYDGGRGLAVDQLGNIYLSGSYNGTVSFGTITPATASAYPNFFIAKYNSSGVAQWVTTATNAGFGTSGQFAVPEPIVIDPCGNLYVTGSFVSTAVFGANSVTTSGTTGVFTAKCLNNGTGEWVSSGTGTGTNTGAGIALDKNANVYVTGDYTGTATFGSQSITATGISDAFVAKYSNSTGSLQWVQTATGSGISSAEGITVDNLGFVYVTGSIQNPCTFGTNTISGGDGDVFIAKLDTVPSPNYITAELSNQYCPGVSLAIPYNISGTFNNGNVFTAQLSDSSGSFVNSVNIGTVTSTVSGTLAITIPSNVITGTHYLIRIISSNPATSSYASCSNYITISNKLTVSLTSSLTDSVCKGANIILTATGGTGYTWNTGATTGGISVIIASDTTFTLVATSGSCTTDTSISFNVKSASAPAIAVTPISAELCNSSAVTLTATGATTYTWSPSTGLNTTTGAAVVASPTTSTTYTLTGTTGGCSSSDNVVVLEGPCQYVWPGDANNDLVVNNYDLIPIGIYFSESGTARDTTTNTWDGHLATNWGASQTNGMDEKYVDCNGDGKINAADTLAITLNYNDTHPFDSPYQPEAQAGKYPLYFLPDTTSYAAGSNVHVAVWLGTANTPVNGIYAIGYDIALNTSLLQAASLSFKGDSSFVGQKAINALTLTHINNDVETAITRFDHYNQSGYGKIGDLYFTISSLTPAQKMVLMFTSSLAVDSSGKPLGLILSTDTLTITKYTGINPLSVNNNQVSIYPNPSSGAFTITSSQPIDEVRVTNILGQTIFYNTVSSFNPNTLNQFTFKLSEEGMYFVTVTSGNNTVTQKLVVSK